MHMSAQVFYDWVSADELEDAHRIEMIGDLLSSATILCLLTSRKDFRQMRLLVWRHSSISQHMKSSVYVEKYFS